MKLSIHKLIICQVKDYKFIVLNHEELFQSAENKAFWFKMTDWTQSFVPFLSQDLIKVIV